MYNLNEAWGFFYRGINFQRTKLSAVKKAASSDGKWVNQCPRSFDTITASSLVNQAALDLENQHDNTRVLSMAVYETSLVSKAIEDAAARRIQTSFRAYLALNYGSQARRALHALKGPVKLQALVRGHLVRKQTATLQCMHALMSIQLQARVQRIQMASKPQLTSKSQLSTHGRLPRRWDSKEHRK
ncbi:uncharacterized protein LOC120128606 [Hibiscus syriacus]|uniref:uncharacterized protein LOC120128606 n=1 Tax=Hibiscus syriacus TaxID=106335 RepID=UPI001920CABA|nr:uncharacterized protein LOC120128606 [Hibiscus syriacus]